MTNQTPVINLNYLFEQNSDFIDYENLPVTFHKNPGAREEEIAAIATDRNQKIPKDYIDFLRKFNGCTLFKYQDLGGFEFLSTTNILKENALQRLTYENDWDSNLTVFCNLICDGDFLSFKNNEDGSYSIMDCYHDDNPGNWKIIADSLDNFLNKLITEKGKRFWL
jgi:SMI1 / KNR4 family (SUKH-1)